MQGVVLLIFGGAGLEANAGKGNVTFIFALIGGLDGFCVFVEDGEKRYG